MAKTEPSDGLYRDKNDEINIMYIHRVGNRWEFEIPISDHSYPFPSDAFDEVEIIEDPRKESERLKRSPSGETKRFKKIISFIERKIAEDVEERRDL